jgi:osmotically-inducible protein OsmY
VTSDDVPQYLAAHIQEQVAARTHELGIRVDVRGDTVFLRGEVRSADRCREIEEAARALAGGRAIQNDVSVLPLGEPG